MFADDKACAVCVPLRGALLSNGDDELVQCCPNCVDGQPTYVHMRCFRRLPVFVGKSGNRLETIRHCANQQCDKVFSATFDGRTFDIPNINMRRVLFHANPWLWAVAVVAYIIAVAVFVQCNTNLACRVVSFVFYAIFNALTVAGSLLKINEPLDYVEFSGCREHAVRKLQVELCVVASVVAIAGLGAFATIDQIALANRPFALWNLIVNGLVVPIICAKHIYLLSKMLARVKNCRIGINVVTFVSPSRSVVYN